jgi:hypothetical protein
VAQVSQLAPAKPLSHKQLPLAWGMPWELQVGTGTSQPKPVYPTSQVQVPEAEQLPWPWHVVEAEHEMQRGYK